MHIKFRFALSKHNVLRRFGGKEADGGLGCTKEQKMEINEEFQSTHIVNYDFKTHGLVKKVEKIILVE